MRLLFVKDFYVDAAWFVPVVALNYGINMVMEVGANSILRAAGRSDRSFAVNGVGAAVTLGIGVTLTVPLGLSGTAVGLVLSAVASAVVAVVLLRREMRERFLPPPRVALLRDQEMPL